MSYRCVICDKTEWESVDKYLYKPIGLAICTNCGHVSYPDEWKDPGKLKAFYRDEYRAPPTAGNLFAGQRKNHYHLSFLKPLIEEWKKKDLKDPSICDVGAAYGMFLEMFKKNMPASKVTGVELTTSYRRVAEHQYGINLTEDFDTKKKYDLICSYKSAEHIQDVDKEMIKWKEALTEDGRLYISVPTWFKTLSNFGCGGFDLHYYFTKAHIQCWTQKLFETLLKKVGLEIIDTNFTAYGETYLCKRNDELMKKTPVYEDPKAIIENLDKIYRASRFFEDGKYKEAIDLWPNFPTSRIYAYEMNKKQWHDKGFDKIKSEMFVANKIACPGDPEITSFHVDISMRYGKYEEAIVLCEENLKQRPNDPIALRRMIDCFAKIGDLEKNEVEKIKYYTQARDIAKYLGKVSMQSRDESISLCYYFDSKIPASFEEILK